MPIAVQLIGFSKFLYDVCAGGRAYHGQFDLVSPPTLTPAPIAIAPLRAIVFPGRRTSPTYQRSEETNAPPRGVRR